MVDILKKIIMVDYQSIIHQMMIIETVKFNDINIRKVLHLYMHACIHTFVFVFIFIFFVLASCSNFKSKSCN